MLSGALAPAGDAWRHLAATVLPQYLRDTLVLVVSVGLGVSALGAVLGWLVAAYDFPGRRFFEWGLLLPLAMPAYVVAYAYADWLAAAGPVQTGLRAATGWRVREYWFPEVASLGGAAVLFTLVLYPYVYLLARAAFAAQSAALLESGRLLGRGAAGSFFTVALPLARPAIAAGTAFALMETLADYGAVSYLAVHTLASGIFKVWLGYGDRVAAAQLAALLLLVVVAVVALERLARRGARFWQASGRRARRERLKGLRALAAVAVCLAPLLLGFLLPVAILARLIVREPGLALADRFWSLAANSFVLAACAAAVAVVLALFLGYARRLAGGFGVALAHQIASLGYAVPGIVIAIGLLATLGALDRRLSEFASAHFGVATGLVFTGSLAALVYAYVVRFNAIGLQSIEAGLARITPSMDEAARTLGAGPLGTALRVHVPMLAPSAAAAALFVFVDVLKELPATLALRPFNFDTLAVEVYNLAKDERLAEAAVPSLAIVAVGLVPVMMLARRSGRG